MVSVPNIFHLKEPFRISRIVKFIVEEMVSTTEWISIVTVGQSPANCPIRNSTKKNIEQIQKLGPKMKQLFDIIP